MKKLLIVLLVILFVMIGCSNNKRDVYTENNISMVARTKGKSFQIYKNGSFESSFLTGVNMGAALPGSFPGAMAIPKEMYTEWFQMIHEMNADVIRVYTTQMPHFYEALYEFNQTVDNPLYIMHGLWLNEEDIRDIKDPYANNEYMLNNFIQDGKDLVDIIHGNGFLEEKPGFASGEYKIDVSKYVIGWILGIEWDPNFVINTNNENIGLEAYLGDYLYSTVEANPFEIFLTEVGDRIIQYEVEKYQFMRPLSFVNWPTTDHLSHPNEPDLKEDAVSVNMNHIQGTDEFIAGFFASFHVYPYYPEFINYSLEYRNYIDHRGETNTYQAYLKDLISKLDMPVIIAEFGVPASRGKTHDDINRGFNQGFLSEEEQGYINAILLEDIYVSDYAGAFLFTWQDEWFKRTWNSMDFDLPSRRPFWSNVQTNEQHFGLLAFEPGEEERIRYVDGDTSDWEGETPLYSDYSLDLYTAFDARYVYIMIESKIYDLNNHELIIPIQTSPNQGNDHLKDSNITFNQTVDFMIKINGDSQAEILVDAYYDPFYFLYNEKLEMLDKNPIYRTKNTGIFNSIYQALSASLHLPEEDIDIPFSKHNTGILTHGNANPYAEEYNSLADYYINGQTIEIKIPWLLLNISDPSTKMRLADFYQYDWFVSELIESISFGAALIIDDQNLNISLVSTTWDSWEEPQYHMRLKESYYIIQEAFKLYEFE